MFQQSTFDNAIAKTIAKTNFIILQIVFAFVILIASIGINQTIAITIAKIDFYDMTIVLAIVITNAKINSIMNHYTCNG